jgi:polar amino acid transport system permease protein
MYICPPGVGICTHRRWSKARKQIDMPNWLTPEITQLLAQGLRLTLILTLITTLLSMGLGLVVGSLRLLRQRWARLPALLFVEIFRNIPAIVLIIFWAYAFPNLFPAELRQRLFFNNFIVNRLSDVTGLPIPWYAIAAILALTLNTAAYIAELFRAGVGAIAQEHVHAAQTMGATWPAIFKTLLIPGGVRAAYPAITTRLIHNLKNTALVSIVAVPELFNSIHTAITRSFLAVEFLTLAALLYLGLALGLSALLRWLERFLYPHRRVSAL